MWQGGQPSPVDERDRGLARLRSWTVGLVAAAGVLVVVLASVAAATFPGSSAAATDRSSGSSTPAAPSDDEQESMPPATNQTIAQPQPPTAGLSGGVTRRAHAVSGAS